MTCACPSGLVKKAVAKQGFVVLIKFQLVCSCAVQPLGSMVFRTATPVEGSVSVTCEQ